MRVYISADIEGVSGISHWDETNRATSDYKRFQQEMMREVIAACEGANKAGATEIWVQDAHDSARNLSYEGMPKNVRIVNAWSSDPRLMMQACDETFDAAIMIGYHSYAGANTNPLAHTLSTKLASLKFNDEPVSEFVINMFTAALYGVPTVFVSGDEGLCHHAEQVVSNILYEETNSCEGRSVISRHPEVVCEGIKTKVEQALRQDVSKCLLELPEFFKVELVFKDHVDAFRNSFYPGMIKVSENTILFESDDYYDVLRMFIYVL